jgi:ABC-2 type transport system ATP-binding protein
MIELVHLYKNFGALRAVDDLNLTVARGELFALLGPNAAGKTTTLKILAGLMRPSSGTARVAGFDIQRHPLEARQKMAFVPDFPFLYEKLTPWEFLQFTGQIFRMPVINGKASEMLERFHLQTSADLAIETLSHGTRQRVALAAALLHDPEVLIIDEPMVGLDPQHARVVKDVFEERARSGTSILLSTHQLALAEQVADRIGIMHRGRLIAVGSADVLREQSGAQRPLEEAFLALTAESSPGTGEN